MTSTSDIKRRMRAQPDCFQVKSNDAGKSEVWKHFSLIYEKNGDELSELKYFCACNGCRKVDVYRAQDGSSYGTKKPTRSCVSVLQGLDSHGADDAGAVCPTGAKNREA